MQGTAAAVVWKENKGKGIVMSEVCRGSASTVGWERAAKPQIHAHAHALL